MSSLASDETSAETPRWIPRLLYALGFLSLAALVAITYRQGKLAADVEWRLAMESRKQLEQERDKARNEIERLKAALEFEQARANRELQINKKALDEVSQTLLATSKEIASLKEDLRFYESVIRAEGNGQGVQVRALRIFAADQPGKYGYTLIIVNGSYGKKKVKGAAIIELVGTGQGSGNKVVVKDEKGSEKLPLHFKYFQRVDGFFTLPDHFQPSRLHVKINVRNSKTTNFEKWYDWPLLVADQVQENRQIPADPQASGVEYD